MYTPLHRPLTSPCSLSVGELVPTPAPRFSASGYGLLESLSRDLLSDSTLSVGDMDQTYSAAVAITNDIQRAQPEAGPCQ
jgi:hypothetical protein